MVQGDPMPEPTATNIGSMPGPAAVAGQILLRNTLTRGDIDPKTQQIIAKQLGSVLPGRPVAAGATADQRTASPDDLALLIPSAAVTAAGVDPAKVTSPPPPVLWTSAGSQLLVQLAGIKTTVTTGIVELTIPVSCDQTGDTTVTVTFVTGSTGRPTGGLTTTEDHPRGDPVIVENWHEQLIAFAWNTLLIATSALTGAAGADRSGRALIPNTLLADKTGLTVLPMARHTFFGTGQLQ
jgi:hypothetical protein